MPSLAVARARVHACFETSGAIRDWAVRLALQTKHAGKLVEAVRSEDIFEQHAPVALKGHSGRDTKGLHGLDLSASTKTARGAASDSQQSPQQALKSNRVDP